MRKKIFGLLGLMLSLGLAIKARAIETHTIETFGAEILYSARTSSVSTHTVTGMMTSYSVTAIGGTCDFTVRHSTNPAGTDFVSDNSVNIGSKTFVLSGQSIAVNQKAIVMNPQLIIERIDANTTAYVLIQYLKTRFPGEY